MVEQIFARYQQVLHQGFFEQALKHPKNIALCDAHNVRVGYGELRQRALAVAAGLQQQGVKSGDCVAVLLPRGIEQVIAVLGIMAV
ncbi:long-chain fatty acid--CoA ligase [Serratia symbiotica]|uniref:AMP-binding protein n=1 Tax=Serratia symbiotica TaxID=138074 RepID=UPI001E18FB6D|nr:AMP-binding protein [Serratia symbiotica]NIG88039.1 long-chain fatty acid--CoA ligase [Serratia symbiotica]USS96506.1 long-chain fatty acid--CoA ligase [Serratia symbiotica]